MVYFSIWSSLRCVATFFIAGNQYAQTVKWSTSAALAGEKVGKLKGTVKWRD